MTTKHLIFFLLATAFLSCSNHKNVEEIKNEVFQAEKSFEKMCADSGIAIAFSYFADENAVILRGNDSIIKGKEAIRNYYQKTNVNASVSWTADFVAVSEDGTMAYTYGKYIWKTPNTTGGFIENKGVFHTVWKKQKDNSWKYVWD